jgi:UDPglucose 6-dehydrogenase
MLIFSFNPAQEGRHLVLLQLKMRTIIHPKLMINASTFGLNGTEKLKAVLTDDHWVYFPDIIQEGQAFKSVTSASKMIIGCASQAQGHLEEMLRPLFPPTSAIFVYASFRC